MAKSAAKRRDSWRAVRREAEPAAAAATIPQRHEEIIELDRGKAWIVDNSDDVYGFVTTAKDKEF